MRNKVIGFSILISFFILFTGCAKKGQFSVEFEQFTPNPAVIQKSGTVFLADVVDKREDRVTVGKIVKKSEVVAKVKNNQPLDIWLKDAIKKSLEAGGCTVSSKKFSDERVAKVKFELNSLKAILDKSKLTGENLYAEAKGTIYISQGNSKVVKKISFSQSKWALPLAGEDEIKSYLQDTLANLVNEIKENIDCYRF